MEFSPPPLFKQGPSALARLIFFVALALALLVSDARFNTLEIVRGIVGTAIYPLQRAALVPRDLFRGAADLAVTSAQLRLENAALRKRNLALSMQANQASALAADNAHLRAVLGLRERIAAQSTPVEIQYDTSDPFSQKIVIGQGLRQGIQDGAPVVNEDGVVGQVTRAFPLQSEVTLVTDRDSAVPVEVLRTGLRSVVYGTPKGDQLELRFVPTTADIVAGDELVTSGLGDVYPPGLPVAKVVRVEKSADTAFMHVVCVPIAAARAAGEMLVLHYQNDIPPRPVDTPPADAGAKGKKAAKTKGAKDRKDAKADAKATEKADAKTNAKAAKPGAADTGNAGARPAHAERAHGAPRPAAPTGTDARQPEGAR